MPCFCTELNQYLMCGRVVAKANLTVTVELDATIPYRRAVAAAELFHVDNRVLAIPLVVMVALLPKPFCSRS